MNGAGNAVVKLSVEFGQNSVIIIDRSVRDVTNRRRLDDVSDDKLLDGLVLGRAPGAVGAPDRLDVSAPLFRTSVVPALLRHRSHFNNRGPFVMQKRIPITTT